MDSGTALWAAFGAERAWDLLQWILTRRSEAGAGFARRLVDAVVDQSPSLLRRPEADRLLDWLEASPIERLLEVSEGPDNALVDAVCNDILWTHKPRSGTTPVEQLASDRAKAAALIGLLWQQQLRSASPAEVLSLLGYVQAQHHREELLAFLDILAADHVELHSQGLTSASALHAVGAAIAEVRLAQTSDDPWRLLRGRSDLRVPAVAAPSRLLRARHAVVPFTLRNSELGELVGWSQTAGSSVAVVTGPAGTGKTRLAAEVAESAVAGGRFDQNTAGFLPPREGVRSRPLRPQLVIVDYAEARAAEVDAILHAIVQSGVETKVLLLMRHPESPQDPLSRFRYLQEEVDDLLANATSVSLEVARWSRRERHEFHEVAVDAFATALGVETRLAPPQEKDRSPLELSISALNLLLGSDPSQLSDESRLEAIFAHELKYWQLTARSAGLDFSPELLRRCVALTALVADSISDERSMVEALRLVPDLADSPEREVRTVARWLRWIYPAEDGTFVSRIQPDLLAEWLVSQVGLD